MQIIEDPRAIPQAEFPFIVSCHGSDLVSRLIQWRTGSWCNHSMIAQTQGKFVWESAASWYGEGPMGVYMRPGTILKFYSLVEITPAAIDALEAYVYNRIHSPWWNKAYDWLGIVGQAVGIPKFHTPGLEYCSVDATHALKAMAPYLGAFSRQEIAVLPDEENPGDLDLAMQHFTSVFNCRYQYTFGVAP